MIYDPIVIWQRETESIAVPPPTEIQSREQRFRAKRRLDFAIFLAAITLHLAVSLLEDFSGSNGSIWWVGVIRFALFATWVSFIPCRIASIDNSSLTDLRVAATTPVFDFYRRQLRRERDYFQDDFRKKFQVIALVLGTVIYSLVYPRLFLVFALPILVGGMKIYKRRTSELPEIQRELQMLDSLR